jgi:hypothetical protein
MSHLPILRALRSLIQHAQNLYLALEKSVRGDKGKTAKYQFADIGHT